MQQRSIERTHDFPSELLAQWMINIQLRALIFDFFRLDTISPHIALQYSMNSIIFRSYREFFEGKVQKRKYAGGECCKPAHRDIAPVMKRGVSMIDYLLFRAHERCHLRYLSLTILTAEA